MIDLKDHVINIGNNGFPQPSGPFGSTESQIRDNLRKFYERTSGWVRRRLLLISHGGLVAEAVAVKWFAAVCEPILRLQVYPMAVVWNSDLPSILINVLEDHRRQHRVDLGVEALGLTDTIAEQVTDPLIEYAVRRAGRDVWEKMKRNAEDASSRPGGALAVAAAEINAMRERDEALEVHLVGHSAGAVINGPLLELLARDHGIATCTFHAPACTLDFFQARYAPAIAAGKVGLTSLFNMTARAERDDSFLTIYRKSLLWLVAHAFEGDPAVGGAPLLGLSACLAERPELARLLGQENIIETPTAGAREGSRFCSEARTHAGFALDDERRLTLRATLCRAGVVQ